MPALVLDAKPFVSGTFDQTGLPNLWVPRASAFFKVDAIPYLGTGKVDLRKVRELAASC